MFWLRGAPSAFYTLISVCFRGGVMKGYGVAVIVLFWLLPGVALAKAVQVQGQEEQQFDVEYLPPMASDLIKRERAHERQEQLESIRKIVAGTGKKAKKNKRNHHDKKQPIKGMMLQVLAEKAALEQEVFDLIKKQYEDAELQQTKISLQVK